MAVPKYKDEEQCIEICKNSNKRCRLPRLTENYCNIHRRMRGIRIKWTGKID